MKILKLLPKMLKPSFLTENPVFFGFAFLCPALAVTLSAGDSLRLGLVILFALVLTSAGASALKRFADPRSSFLCTAMLAAFSVSLGVMFLAAFWPLRSVSSALFLPLAAAGCLTLCIGGFAADSGAAGVVRAVFIGAGAVFALALASVIRGALAYGVVFGRQLFGANYPGLTFFLTPAGAFVALGLTAGVLQFLSNIRLPRFKKPAKESPEPQPEIAAQAEDGEGKEVPQS